MIVAMDDDNHAIKTPSILRPKKRPQSNIASSVTIVSQAISTKKQKSQDPINILNELRTDTLRFQSIALESRQLIYEIAKKNHVMEKEIIQLREKVKNLQSELTHQKETDAKKVYLPLEFFDFHDFSTSSTAPDINFFEFEFDDRLNQ